MDNLPTGMRLLLGTYCKEEKHPSNGGRSYLHNFWEPVLAVFLNAGGGAAGLSRSIPFWDFWGAPQSQKVSMHGDMLELYPSIDKWRQYSCKIHTGHNFSHWEIHLDDLFNLFLNRIAFPKAIGAEVRAFIYNCNPNLEKQHSPSQLCRVEKRLGLTMKIGSTTSKEA